MTRAIGHIVPLRVSATLIAGLFFMVFFIGGCQRAPTAAAPLVNPGKAYEACRKGLGSYVNVSPALKEVVDTLKDSKELAAKKRSGELHLREFNIGGPYRAGSVNVLIPSAAAPSWLAECGVKDSLSPECSTIPKEGHTICNRAMGKYIENNPFGDQGPEAQIMHRYFIGLILGHEIAHYIYSKDAQRAHLNESPRNLDTDCYSINKTIDHLQIESKCDHVGIQIACETVPNDIKLDESILPEIAVSIIRNTLLVQDELCLSSYKYSSMTSRIRKFTNSMLECVSPKVATTPISRPRMFMTFLSALERDLEEVENFMRTSQRRGWAGSPTYKSNYIRYQRVFALPQERGFIQLEIDRDRNAGLFVSQRPLNQQANVGASSLFTLRKALRGTVAFSASEPIAVAGGRSRQNGVALWLDTRDGNGNNALLKVVVSCVGEGIANCNAREEARYPWHGGAALSMNPAGGVLLVDGSLRSTTRTRIFDDPDKLVSGQASIDRLPVTSKELLLRLSVHSPALALAIPFQKGGRSTVEVIDNGPRRAISLPLPEPSNEISVADIFPTSSSIYWLTDSENLARRGPLELWECPHSILQASPRPSLSCRVFQVPYIMHNRYFASMNTLPADLSHINAPAPGCPQGLAISARGWSWLLDFETNRSTVLPANGVARCSRDLITTYRAGRIDEFDANWETLTPKIVHLSSSSSP